MQSKSVLVDRQALQAELRQVFDARTTRTLLGVLDKVAAQMRQTGVTREDFGELKPIVAGLAEAQQRTEQRVAELAEAQQRTEQRVAELAEAQQRTEQRVAELAEAQRHTDRRLMELAAAQQRTGERLDGVEERLSRLETVVAELATAQQRTEERLSRLESNILILTEQVRALVESQQKIVDDLGGLKGRVLELAYRDKVVSYFGRLLRRPTVVDLNALWETLETRLPPEAFNDVLLVDLVVQGRPRQQVDLGDMWLAVEVSSVVNEEDVRRARQRAEALRQAGYRAVPVVAGERTTLAADDEARQHKVVVLRDGRSFLWDEALAAWGA